jgi:hypothetical protein
VRGVTVRVRVRVRVRVSAHAKDEAERERGTRVHDQATTCHKTQPLSLRVIFCGHMASRSPRAAADAAYVHALEALRDATALRAALGDDDSAIAAAAPTQQLRLRAALARAEDAAGALPALLAAKRAAEAEEENEVCASARARRFLIRRCLRRCTFEDAACALAHLSDTHRARARSGETHLRKHQHPVASGRAPPALPLAAAAAAPSAGRRGVPPLRAPAVHARAARGAAPCAHAAAGRVARAR